MRVVLGCVSPFLAVAVLLAAGCGSEGTDGSGAVTAGPISTPPAGSGSGAPSPTTTGSPHRQVKRFKKTIFPRPVRWTSATPVMGGRALRISWGSGVEPCRVLDRVEIVFGPKTVRVTVYEGAGDLRAVCIELLVEKTATVKLTERIGKRRITDGARR